MTECSGDEAVLVLTNDDGIDAPGLAALEAATAGLGSRLVIAPRDAWSSGSHAVTTHREIGIDRPGAGRVALGGTPADCARWAVHEVGPRLAWVLSGINAGGNLGVDIHHSGTVAAAREAAIHGRPAIALSHYLARGLPLDWVKAAARARRALDVLLERPLPVGCFWNVNLPHPGPGEPEPEIVFCPVDASPLPLAFQVSDRGARYSGNYHERPRAPGTDVDLCFRGFITVSLLSLRGGEMAKAAPRADREGLGNPRAPGA